MISAGSAARGSAPTMDLPASGPRSELAGLLDHLPVAIWMRDGEGRISYANSAAADMVGVDRPLRYVGTAESLGWTVCDERGRPLSREEFVSVVAYRSGQPLLNRTIGLVKPDGTTQWLLVNCIPHVDDSGQRRVLCSAVDVTAAKQNETALRASEERYRRIVETTHEGLCLLDADSRITFANARLCEMLGYAVDELVGLHSFDLFDMDAGTVFRRSRTASPRERDVALRHKDGSTVWAIVSGVPMIDENDGTRGMLAMFTNVTERKLSEERAVAAAQQIERLTADAIYTVDRGGVIRSWNDGAERMFGWTKQEIVGRGPALVPAHLRATATEAILRIVDAGETLIRETVRLTKDGEPVPVLGSWSPVPLPEGGTGVLCILKDTREQQAAHQKLEEQAKSLALLRERERIAMDLHDGVIQSLYGVTLSLGGLRRLQDRRSPDHGVLGHAITQLTETVQGIRDYIFELRAGAPENAADLEAGLRAAAEDLSVTSGITSRVSVAADLARLPAGTISHLLYIVREALSNVARHARATEVAITVEPHRRGLTLTLTDNGRGFDPRRRGRRLGDGLRNMRWRAGQLGATLAIDSAPGAGTTVRVELP